MRARNALYVLVPTAAVAVALGIYFGDSGGVSLDPVAAAATRSAALPGYDVALTASFSAAGRTFAMNGTGVANTAQNAIDLKFDITGLPTAAGANGVSGEEVVIDKTIYLHMGLLQGRLPNGKTWLEIDAGKADRALGMQLSQAGQMDPANWLQALRADANVQDVGTDTIDSVQATHYHADIDVSKLANIPAKQRAAVEAQLRQSGVSTIPVDVWVDSSGLVRREAMTLDTTQLTMRLQADFSNFGTATTVSAPPASEVFDMTRQAIATARASKP